VTRAVPIRGQTVSSPPQRPDRAESVRTRGFIGGVLGTAFAVALGFGLIVPALPAFAVELGAGFGAASAVVAAFAGVRLLFSGPAGVLVDRRQVRTVVAVGLLIVAVSSGLTALARTYLELLLLRGAGGVGSAMFIVGIGQHVVRTVPSRERGRANGLLQGAFLLGGASGPAVGGLVVDLLGIRAPFVIYAAGLLIATVVTLNYLDEEAASDEVAASGDEPEGGGGARDGGGRDPEGGGGDPEGGGSGGVEEEFSGGQPEVPAADAAPLTALLIDEPRAAFREVLRDRTFWASLYIYMAIAWAAQGTRFVAVPLLGSEVLGQTIGLVGIALTVSSVAHGALLWPASRTADSRGRLLPLRVGMLLYVVSMVGLTAVAGPVGLVLWMLVQGAANGIASPMPASVVGDLAPLGAEGRAVGLMNVARDVGAVAGPLATGVIAEYLGFDAAFILAAVLLGIGFAVTFLMRETLER
jgi:MFS transporter, DHA1 family, multidrug resistance protein